MVPGWPTLPQTHQKTNIKGRPNSCHKGPKILQATADSTATGDATEGEEAAEEAAEETTEEAM